MTKKQDDSATATLTRNVKKTAAHEDARGRRIEVQQLDALQYYRLLNAMGSLAENESALDFAMTAATVRRIDTTHFPIPTKHSDVEFAIQQLDFDGIAAAGLALKSMMTNDEDTKAELVAAKN